jgi:hypothetical protein
MREVEAMAADTESGGGRGANLWRIGLWGGAALLLLTPLVAMQVSDEWRWGVGSFVLLGGMLGAIGGAIELAARRTVSSAYRAGVAVATVTTFLIIWMNLAVGIIGDEDNPANLMYAGVLAVGLAGSVVARFGPQGMAQAMATTAIIQALVAVAALVLGSVPGAVLTSGFAALWLASAWLFGKAARTP